MAVSEAPFPLTVQALKPPGPPQGAKKTCMGLGTVIHVTVSVKVPPWEGKLTEVPAMPQPEGAVAPAS